jgi:hypothetical protein
MGLRHHAVYSRQRPSNDLLDQAIRKLYANGKPRPGQMAKLCARYDRPRQWVRARAIRLGAIKHTRGRDWTPEEDAILREHEGYGLRKMQKALIAAGIRDRTEPAIQERCLRALRISTAEDRDPDLYSATEIAELMGEDTHRVINWIHRGGLPARAEREPNGRVSRWNVRRADLRRWLIEHPQSWLPARADRFWLIEILAGRVGSLREG